MKERTGENLRLSLNFMMKYDIPATPANYYLSYEHVSGVNSKLSAVINKIVESGYKFSDNLLEDLYQNFIAEYHCQEHMKTAEDVEHILEHLIDGISQVEGDVTLSSRKLKKFALSIQEESRMDEIREIAGVISRTAEGLAETGKKMNEKLRLATDEIEDLKRKLEKTREESMTDTLTGLVNRRGMERFAGKVLKDVKDSGQPLSLVMADIDHFKRINDQFGHLVGDNVIRIVAGLLNKSVAEGDRVIRYGGEEYLILLPGKSAEEAREWAEEVRGFMENKSWKENSSGKSMGQITLSFGIAQLEGEDSLEPLIARADGALYQSKGSGRNRVTVATGLN